MAWVSDGSNGPADRFTRSSVPYVTRRGTIVARDWADLTDGSLIYPIDVNTQGEDGTGGEFVSGCSVDLVWSNTDTAGEPGARRTARTGRAAPMASAAI